MSGRELAPLPWQQDLGALLREYSTNREYRPYDLVSELTRHELFLEAGRRTTAPVDCAQTLADYVESFHTRNGFSRARMTAAAAGAFDVALQRLVASSSADGWIRGVTQATVVWGRRQRPGS